jgi:hypothetical protein
MIEKGAQEIIRAFISYNLDAQNLLSCKLAILRNSCLPVFLSVSLFDCYLSVGLSFCLSLSICLPVCLSICLSVCQSTCLYVYMSVCLYACLSVCLSVCVSIYLSDHPSICLSLHMPICQVGHTSVSPSVYLPLADIFACLLDLSLVK